MILISLLTIAAVLAKHQAGQLVNLLTDAGAITVNQIYAWGFKCWHQTLHYTIKIATLSLISNETKLDFCNGFQSIMFVLNWCNNDMKQFVVLFLQSFSFLRLYKLLYIFTFGASVHWVWKESFFNFDQTILYYEKRSLESRGLYSSTIIKAMKT